MTDRELDKRAAHRLAVIRHAQEVTGNVSKTCRYYGIGHRTPGVADDPLIGGVELEDVDAGAAPN